MVDGDDPGGDPDGNPGGDPGGDVLLVVVYCLGKILVHAQDPRILGSSVPRILGS